MKEDCSSQPVIFLRFYLFPAHLLLLLLLLRLLLCLYGTKLKPFATFHILYLLDLVSLMICSLFFSVLWKRFSCPAMCHLFLMAKLIYAAVILNLKYLI